MAKIISKPKRTKFPVKIECRECKTVSAFEKDDFHLNRRGYIVCVCPVCGIEWRYFFSYDEEKVYWKKASRLTRFLAKHYFEGGEDIGNVL